MKIRIKILAGFLAVAAIVGVAGGIGIISSSTIMANSDMILEEKAPMKDVSMEAIISVTAGRDACGEFLLSTDIKRLKYELALTFISKVEALEQYIKALKENKMSVEELQQGGFNFKKYVLNNFELNFYNPSKITEGIKKLGG